MRRPKKSLPFLGRLVEINLPFGTRSIASGCVARRFHTSGMRPPRALSAARLVAQSGNLISTSLLTVLLIGAIGAGCPNEARGPGPRTGPDRRRPTPDPRSEADAAAAKRALETICDRMEDCAIERNVALARGYGGDKADLEAARLQARVALHSGYVRRWCLMRLSGLPRSQLLRIHGCLARTACDPFYRCAHRAQTARKTSQAPPSARLPK